MSPHTLSKFFPIFLVLFGVILATEDSYYSYWRPENSADFHEDAFQSLQSVNQERQDLSPHPITKFINGIQNRQFGAGIAPVSFNFSHDFCS